MFACVYVPDFPVQAVMLDESKEQPCALLDGPESLLKVIACNKAARRDGVYVGMTKLQAEAYGVNLRKRSPQDEDSAQAILLDCAYGFSPRIEATDPGTIIIDLTGSVRLLGDEKTVAGAIKDRVADHGFETNVSIAANADTAHYAARGFSGITVIEEGDEARRLSALPVGVLEVEPEVMEILEAWGIKNLKVLAALPEIALTERLGQYGLHLQRLAKGSTNRELIPAGLPTIFNAKEELEEPIELLEPLGFILNRLLEELIGRLIERSLATDHINVELGLEINADRDTNALPCRSGLVPYGRTIKLPVPVQDGRVLLKLLQLDLAAHPPHAAVKKITIEAIPARIRYTQAGLFQPGAPEAAKLDISVARIRAVVGESDSQGRLRVGMPALLDSHSPDHFQVVQPGSKHVHQPMPDVPQLALRRFRPVIPARVELNGEKVPAWLGFLKQRVQIIRASGPWTNGGEWWDAKGKWLREEWDVDISLDGHTRPSTYRIFQELTTHRWFVEATYE
jgi:protein ImuB